MTGGWQARFEIVAGPNDGLVFTMTGEEVVLDGELLGPPPGSGLAPKDLDDVEVRVSAEGVELSCEVPLRVNGREVGGSRLLREGDVVRVGMTEMVLIGYAAGPPDAAEEDGEPDDSPALRPPAAPRRCLRPGCGALNPPDATWCRTCGWDLEDTQ